MPSSDIMSLMGASFNARASLLNSISPRFLRHEKKILIKVDSGSPFTPNKPSRPSGAERNMTRDIFVVIGTEMTFQKKIANTPEINPPSTTLRVFNCP